VWIYQESLTQQLTHTDREIFNEKWTYFVGREPQPPYRRYKLLPVELFDPFMSSLPPKLGWTQEERNSLAAKRKVRLSQWWICNLPEAMEALYPL
jgi:hypothetical protein